MARRPAKGSRTLLQERKGNPQIDFFMVIMASGIARLGHVFTMTTELPKMVTICQLKVVREMHPLFIASFAIGHQ